MNALNDCYLAFVCEENEKVTISISSSHAECERLLDGRDDPFVLPRLHHLLLGV